MKRTAGTHVVSTKADKQATRYSDCLFQLLHLSQLQVGKDHDDDSDDAERQDVWPQTPLTVVFDTLICQIF